MTQALIIAGFPGIGKSWFFTNHDSKLSVKDSDSSNFSWIKPGVRHPNFPNNYIDYIKRIRDQFDIILVSTHEVVRKALDDNNIEYILIYPDRSLKQEYIDRYTERGSPQAFIELLDKQWDTWIDQMEEADKIKRVLAKDEYLADVIYHTPVV
jgi:hypothetical protein